MVPYAVRAYNFSYHTSLGDTPYFNFYHRDPSGGYGCLISEQGESKTEAAIKAKYCAELARRQLLLSQDKRQKKGEVKSAVRYDIGDLVYLRYVTISDRLYKLKYQYQGPYRIIDIFKNTVTLKFLKTGKTRRASLRNVRLYATSLLSRKDNPNIEDPMLEQEEEIPESTDLTQVDSNSESETGHRYNTRARAKR